MTTGGFDTARLTWPCRFESGDVAVISPGQSDVTSVNFPSASATARTVNRPSPVIDTTRHAGTLNFRVGDGLPLEVNYSPGVVPRASHQNEQCEDRS